jgi:NAD(P)-dependent dehydrogenase (short-subunit alcohol dehydrogenase family)
MKIAITGHTDGIGLAIAQRRNERGDAIDGFSRTNGWELPAMQRELVKRLVEGEYDVFVNNVHADWSQVEVLHDVWHQWMGSRRTIICVGSRASNLERESINVYDVQKVALDAMCRQLQRISCGVKVVNLRLGYVDTARVAHRPGNRKMTVQQVADVVDWILAMPDNMVAKEMLIDYHHAL